MDNLNNSMDSDDELLIQIELFVLNDLLAKSRVLEVCPSFLTNDPTRNENYYEATIPAYSLEEFRTHFRMTRSCFAKLLHAVGHKNPHIQCMEKKLLFFIWTVSKQESFLSAGDRFNLSKSSAHLLFCEILHELCSLMEDYIKWPPFHQYNSISQAFKEKSGGFIPGIIGAIDGCHIEIKQPRNNCIDYYNRKNTHSIVLQGVCDDRCRFTDVYIGAPGRQHDARVFRNSPLFGQINDLVSGEYHLLGDAAYPLKNNLITPFRDNGHLTSRQHHFNTRLSSARVTIERTFGLLKGRFRRLKYLDVAEPMMANRIISCCCILHNHIQMNCPDDMNEVELDVEDNDLAQNRLSNDMSTPPLRSNSNEKRNYLLSLFS